MAVDLARDEVGHRAGGGDGVRALQLAEALVDVEGPGEGGTGVDPLVAQPRQPGQEHVDLELRALGRRLGLDRPGAGAASSWLRTAGARPDSTVAPARAAQALGRRHVTSPPGSTETTSAPVSTVAPAATAARASPSVTAPMPPTGTSQSPVPPPMRW